MALSFARSLLSNLVLLSQSGLFTLQVPNMSAAVASDAVGEGDGYVRVRRLSLPTMTSSLSPVAPLSPPLAAIKTSVVFSAAKRLVQVKENLTEFHKKGGIVGWLHGDEGEPREPSGVEQSGGGEAGDEQDEEDVGDSFALAYSPTNPKREALDALALATSSLWASGKPSGTPEDSSPSSPSIYEPVLTDGDIKTAGGGADEGEDDGLHTPPSPRSASASPDKAAVALSAAGATSMVRRERSGSSSMLESLYEKVVKASAARTSSSSPRVSLQPSPRRKSVRADALASGFDDFVSAESSARRSKASQTRVSPSLYSLAKPI